ncbi:hypothetical protein ACQRIT_007442 [Beauveria bassiana]
MLHTPATQLDHGMGGGFPRHTRCSMLPTEHQLRSNTRHEHRLSAAYMHRERMLALADLLNPPPSQKGRAPEAVMVEADAPANPDPNTANEQILSNDAKSAKHSAQTKRSASLIGSAVSFASLYKSESKKTALEILNMFDNDVAHLINGVDVDQPHNAITLTLDLHLALGNFDVYFTQITNRPHTYETRMLPVTRALYLSRSKHQPTGATPPRSTPRYRTHLAPFRCGRA